jgi:hypothetical protein
MALLNKFTTTSTLNGIEFTYTRISETRYREDWMKLVDGLYERQTSYFTPNQIQDALLKGTMVITNPATLDDDYEERELPSPFYFTNVKRVRYTAYIQDDIVTVSWGSGIRTETQTFPLWAVKGWIAEGLWKVLPDSHRTPNRTASEFMQFMENYEGPLSVDDHVAIAQTIVLLNKIMYS